MYEELVERLRKTYTVCGWDDLKSAADAIEALESELDRLRREEIRRWRNFIEIQTLSP